MAADELHRFPNQPLQFKLTPAIDGNAQAGHDFEKLFDEGVGEMMPRLGAVHPLVTGKQA